MVCAPGPRHKRGVASKANTYLVVDHPRSIPRSVRPNYRSRMARFAHGHLAELNVFMLSHVENCEREDEHQTGTTELRVTATFTSAMNACPTTLSLGDKKAGGIRSRFSRLALAVADADARRALALYKLVA